MSRPWIHGPVEARVVLVAMAAPREKPEDVFLDDLFYGLAGLDRVGFWNAFGRIALIDEPARVEESYADPQTYAHERALALIPELAGRRAVLLGRDVEQSFQLGPLMDWLVWARVPAERGAELPWEVAVSPMATEAPRWWTDRHGAAMTKTFWRTLPDLARPSGAEW